MTRVGNVSRETSPAEPNGGSAIVLAMSAASALAPPLDSQSRPEAQARSAEALAPFDRSRPDALFGHFDADGHGQASGGALRPADWNSFIARLGFGPEEEVAA